MTSSVMSPVSASFLRTSSSTSGVVMPSTTVMRRCTCLPDCSSSITFHIEVWAGISYSPALIGLGVGSIIRAIRNSREWAMTPSSSSTLAMVDGPAPRGITTLRALSSGPAVFISELPSHRPPPITVTNRAMKKRTHRK